MTSGPLNRRHLRHVGENADAGIVYEDVEAAKPPDHTCDRLFDVGVASHVGALCLHAVGTETLEFQPRVGQDATH